MHNNFTRIAFKYRKLLALLCRVIRAHGEYGNFTNSYVGDLNPYLAIQGNFIVYSESLTAAYVYF